MESAIYVSDYSPAGFFDALQDSIRKGYYADDSVAGYPYFNAPNEIKLFEREQPEQRHDFSRVNTIVIEGFDNTYFVLDVQDAVLQGFSVDPESIELNRFAQPHTLVMKRAEDKAVGQDAADAEKAPEEPVEAPKPVNKGGRPRKQKSKEL